VAVKIEVISKFMARPIFPIKDSTIGKGLFLGIQEVNLILALC